MNDELNFDYKELIIGMNLENTVKYNVKYCKLLINLAERYYKMLILIGNVGKEIDGYQCKIRNLFNILKKNYDFDETIIKTKNSILLYELDNDNKVIIPKYYVIKQKPNRLSIFNDYLLNDMYEKYKEKEGNIQFAKFIREIVLKDKVETLYKLYPHISIELEKLIIECCNDSKKLFEKGTLSDKKVRTKYDLNKRQVEFMTVYKYMKSLKVSREDAYNEIYTYEVRKDLLLSLISERQNCIRYGSVARAIWQGKSSNDSLEELSEKVRYPLHGLEDKIKNDFYLLDKFYNELDLICKLISKK